MAASLSAGAEEDPSDRLTWTRLGVAIFFSMNVMVFSTALWTLDVYETASASPLSNVYHDLLKYLACFFSIPVYYLLGIPLYRNARSDLERGVFTADWLLLAGVGASFVYSALATGRSGGRIYFEVGCLILLLVTLGRRLEAVGKGRAAAAVSKLERLLPNAARRILDGAEESVPLSELRQGDLIRVIAGERVPADGTVVSGEASVDEQILTGESLPRFKSCSAKLLGGSLNLDGNLVVEVGENGASSTLSRLVEFVRTALERKGKHQRIADRVSAFFLPVFLSTAILAASIHGYRSGVDQGILTGLAVVLISCPCALGIATPIAVWASMGSAASRGVLFRSGDVLERLADVQIIFFDKTGTLTSGDVRLIEVHDESFADSARSDRLTAIASSTSNHAFSRVLSEVFPIRAGDPAPTQVRARPGRGVSMSVDGASVFLGNPEFLESERLQASDRLGTAVRQARDREYSLTALGWGGFLRRVFVFEERIRPEAAEALDRCRALGLEARVLTGDHARRGASIADKLGVRVEAELLPEMKAEAVRLAKTSRDGIAMVGDGINDVPALLASDVGIALACGADISRDSAGICLLGDDLRLVPWSIELARKTRRAIRLNLAWAFGYNSVGVVIAALGLLNPLIAGAIMTAGSLFIIGNSLRLAGPEATSESESTAEVE